MTACDSPGNGTNTSDPRFDELNLVAYEFVLPTIVGLGILSNICNLFTLQNTKLQSIPYRYIRSIAVFDLVGLLLVLGACVRIAGRTPPWYFLVLYQAHLELPLLNGFLAGSLFTAVVLSGERYFMICRPHDTAKCCEPVTRFRLNVSMTILLALVLHIPMGLEFYVHPCGDGEFERAANVHINEDPTIETAFHAYEIIRELIRCFAVMSLLILNFIIIRKLREAGRRRRMLRGKRISTAENPASGEEARLVSISCSRGSLKDKRPSRQGRSYEENRITLMMIGMSAVYTLGNLPQACLMPLNEDDYKDHFVYQVFRATANLAEINNHCLNFYIFCFTSRDYYTAFFEICRQLCTVCTAVHNHVPSWTTDMLSLNSMRNETRREPSFAPAPMVVDNEQEIFV